MEESLKKLIITMWNYKGGVGKSTIALVLAEIAAQRGLRVRAVDLDEQRNLAEMLKLTDKEFPSLDIYATLQPVQPAFVEDGYNVYILDTHPLKDNVIISAIRLADVVLVPVMGDFHSVINLRSVFEYVEAFKQARQIAIVKNCMTSLKLAYDIEDILEEQGYPSAGRLPRSNRLIRNIAEGKCWDAAMNDVQRKPFLDLYSSMWDAFANLR